MFCNNCKWSTTFKLLITILYTCNLYNIVQQLYVSFKRKLAACFEVWGTGWQRFPVLFFWCFCWYHWFLPSCQGDLLQFLHRSGVADWNWHYFSYPYFVSHASLPRTQWNQFFFNVLILLIIKVCCY